VFNEVEGIELFCERTLEAVAPLVRHVDLLLVDDGSSDGSLEVLRRLASEDSRIRVLSFSRNFGHQLAVTAGLDRATGDCTVVIDSDLQDPPELIADLLAAWEDGGDVVHAVRAEREGESYTKKLFARVFYKTLQRLAQIDMTRDAGDFRLYDRRAVRVLHEMPERQRFIRGLASWVGFRQEVVTYTRAPRAAGKSKYPIRKSVRLAITAITSFSWIPLQAASALGFLLSFVAGLLIPVFVILRILGAEGLGGQTTVLVAVLFIGGVQLLFMGMIGEYVGRMSEEVKQRPAYVVAFDSAGDGGRPDDPFRGPAEADR
jgi:dolichol-phosphate mannosyltransferase